MRQTILMSLAECMSAWRGPDGAPVDPPFVKIKVRAGEDSRNLPVHFELILSREGRGGTPWRLSWRTDRLGRHDEALCDTTAEVLRLTREVLERETGPWASEARLAGSAA
ncbi:MAG TPA: hypothetical protein VLI67_08220 [Vicinamibacteria bacterium]|nr:hypothetical protein [Vicinamibacteria bacterium]